MTRSFTLDDIVECLKSTAEPSRLRILKLLSSNDLTVSDLTIILGQSQPRVSRHLKLLLESELVRRWQEGSWALFRLNAQNPSGQMALQVLENIDEHDDVFARDAERLEAVKTARRDRASEYFSLSAARWDEIRSLHVADALVEETLLSVTGQGPFNAVLDIGTGTGRVLELLAPYYRSAMGIDANRNMLNVARSNLESAGISHAEVRLDDVYSLSVGKDRFDLVIIHQVLHYLDEPQIAIREAARALAPAGKLVVVDFASHNEEFLRTEHQHQRLGFEDNALEKWFAAEGLSVNDPVQVHNTTGKSGPLSVMIWSADDKRYQIADTEPTRSKEMV